MIQSGPVAAPEGVQLATGVFVALLSEQVTVIQLGAVATASVHVWTGVGGVVTGPQVVVIQFGADGGGGVAGQV